MDMTRAAEAPAKGRKGKVGQAWQNEDLDTAEDVSRVRDVSGMTEAEVLQMLEEETPELLPLLDEFQSSMSELQGKVRPLLEKARSGDINTSKGLSYLEIKNHVLLAY